MVHPLLAADVRREIERAASNHLGRPWVGEAFTDLNDRASHPCGVLHGESLSVFAKLSVAPDGRAQFAAELSGLTLLRDLAEIATPAPVGRAVVEVRHGWLLLLEALSERPPEARTRSDWRSIGHTLGALHRVRGERFGLEDLNGYFGPLPQDNRPVVANRWSEFFAERRMIPLLRRAFDSGHLPGEIASEVERLIVRLPTLCGPEPHPTLLHGDAQQHNFVSTPSGAVVVDAAPYFGHPEADLALIDYFHPVPPDVFDAYQDITPLDPGFARRRELWRMPAYLAVLAVDGGSRFGRPFVARLSEAIAQYR